ncbi:MAG: hypothetical protein R3B09_22680 [Nannocystaceae bacterium]
MTVLLKLLALGAAIAFLWPIFVIGAAFLPFVDVAGLARQEA